MKLNYDHLQYLKSLILQTFTFMSSPIDFTGKYLWKEY